MPNEAARKFELDSIENLRDFQQEILQLRSANNALEFSIQQKDEMIIELKAKLSESKIYNEKSQ